MTGKAIAFEQPESRSKGSTDRIMMTVVVSLFNDEITLQAWPSVNGQTREENYSYQAKSDLEFIIGGDYHRTTLNMLVGIGQRLKRLQEFGFEREP